MRSLPVIRNQGLARGLMAVRMNPNPKPIYNPRRVDEQASASIETFCGRFFASAAGTETIHLGRG